MKFLIILCLITLIFTAVPKHVTAITNPIIPDTPLVANKQDEEIAYENWKSEQLTHLAEKLKGTYQGQCVVAVRNFLGVGRDEIQGLAKNTKINSQEPEVGAIIILNFSSLGHVGVVLFTDSYGYVWYYDSNGSWTQRAAIRKIKIDDRRIRGYRIVESEVI